METDNTTLADLSIFSKGEGESLFDKLDLTRSGIGRERMIRNLSTSLSSPQKIRDVQDTIKAVDKVLDKWPDTITNGTVMVVQRFYESALDPIPSSPSKLSAGLYKLLHGPDFSLARYSVTHCLDLVKGMIQIRDLLMDGDKPPPLKVALEAITKLTNETILLETADIRSVSGMKKSQILKLAYFFRHHYKQKIFDLLSNFAILDAFYGMAAAVRKYSLVFPEVTTSDKPFVEAEGLYHLLLDKPVPYDIHLNHNKNFMFLTGANMAGKSTFIRSVGAAVFMAHTGMGVPAAKMKLSLFDGLLSNINITDNIAKGESYFYNEVNRVKATVKKVSDGRKWLILIDELFKGTNIEDAMKCSQTVIEGLLKTKNCLYILSTHLYELGETLEKYPEINFSYFETEVSDGRLLFNYLLREGISSDRLGYLILQNEGVVKLLQDLR